MDREDILDFNFDWKDEKSFKKTLSDPRLTPKDKTYLENERERRLELEEIKSMAEDYDDYDEDFDDEEETEAELDKKAHKQSEERRSGKDVKSTKSSGSKADKGDSLVVRVKGFPGANIAAALAMCLFIVIIPFVSYLHEEVLTPLTEKYFTAEEDNFIRDWFLFEKEFFVVIFAAALVIYFITDRFFTEHPYKDIPLKKKSLRIPIILTACYALLLILSGVFSENGEVVLMGMVKQYEGLLGVLGYLVIFLAAMNYFNNTRALTYFQNAIVVLAGLAGVLGMLEYMGFPLIDMGFFEHLMSPSDKLSEAQALHSASKNVHITFFNSNYFGGFCGLIFPVITAIAIGSRDIAGKLAGGFFAVLIAICAILSNSSGGLYAVIGSCIVFAVIYLIYWLRKYIDRRQGVIAAAAAAVIAVGGFVYMSRTHEDFISRLEEVVNNGGTAEEEQAKRERKKLTHYILTDIEAKGTSLFLYSDDVCVEAEAYYDADHIAQIRFYDTDRQPLQTVYKNECFYFTDARYKNCSFKFSVSDKLYCDLGYEDKLIFQFEDGKFKPYVHSLYTQDKINKFEGPGIFKDHLKFATGRGFIWGSTIPMLKDCLLLGYGSGNYVIYFPQYDYISLLEVYNTPAMVVNKPHSWYLGIATDSGVLSLLVVLALLGLFIAKGIKRCVLNPVRDEYMHMRLGIFVSVLAFMAVGIVNDSYVCVSPVFWFIFGVGWFAVSGEKIAET